MMENNDPPPYGDSYPATATAAATARRSHFLLPILLLILVASGLRAAAAGDAVIISEFMASNAKTIADENRSFEDWIELRNTGAAPVNLAGWSLTEDARRPQRWQFPATNLPPGAHLVVWASGKDRRQHGAPLHTSFKLASAGEYLGLARPDGTIAHAFSFPAQIPDVAYGFLPDVTEGRYLVAPTPGKPNESAARLPGPLLELVSPPAAALKSNETIAVSVRVLPALAVVTNVALYWRVMFQNETNRPMMMAADQGIWTASIPTGSLRPGEMIRWRITARDAAGRDSSIPLPSPSGKTSKYFGAVMNPGYAHSALPVFQLFVAPGDLRGMDSERGARGCFYYDGEFYDNVYLKVRGNTTAHYPKKSHRLEFPSDHPLRHPGPGRRVRQTSLMAEWGDPTYLRQHLSFWLQSETGSAAPFHYPVRVQLNGEFWQLAMHSEVLGEELLERHGLDPNGALYKAVGTLTTDFDSTGGFEKKTRRQEGNRDYAALAQALHEDRGPDARRKAVFEMLHLPAVINYLAAARLGQEDDDIWANLSLYHDCDGTGEWRPIPFDMNVSWGFSFAHGGVQASHDRVRSHPFFGVAGVGSGQGFNRLYDAIVRVPETREMLLRRMRTILDRWWQPPGTAATACVIEQHIAQMTNRMWLEAIRDRRKWGNSWHVRGNTPPEAALTAGVQDLITNFIEPRRRHFYVTHSITNSDRPVGIGSRHSAGIPERQPDAVQIDIARVQLFPTIPAREYVVLTNANAFAVDLSGWQFEGTVKFTFHAGTVLPARAALHVARDVKTFRDVARRTGADSLFVVGNYRGRLVPDGLIEVKDARGRLVARRGKP